jgi:hypothetical protein
VINMIISHLISSNGDSENVTIVESISAGDVLLLLVASMSYSAVYGLSIGKCSLLVSPWYLLANS